MIVFGCAVHDPEAYRRYAKPGIDAAVEPDSVVNAFAHVGSLGRANNLVMSQAAGLDDLEALVLVHPRCEIADPAFAANVRAALRDPDVAVVGAIGARGVRSAAWWAGDQVHGAAVRHRYTEHGEGEVPAYAWTEPHPGPAEVDAVDGYLMVLSPWAVRTLRFDEGLWMGLGFDVDFCRRAREAGRKVIATDLGAVQHRPLELVSDPDAFTAALLQFAEKWAPDGNEDWQARARRAEAECEAARITAYFHAARGELRLEAKERELAALTDTPGWRATAPLRWVNHWRRQRRAPAPDPVPASFT